MKYFVTGGAGFIGSALVKRLLDLNNHVTVYDDLSAGKMEYIKDHITNKKFKFVKGSILIFSHLLKAMKNHDFVYHLAANSDIKLGSKDIKRDFKINTVGTINVLDAMIKNKIKSIAFASTSAVFGKPTEIPTPENYGPCLPASFYGASKLSCEGFISSYSEIFGLKAWIFRFANITGIPATHGIIHDFVKKIKNNPNELKVLGDGNQEKSYITNTMLVDSMEYIIKKTKSKKERIFLYNIGNNDKVTVRKITELFVSINQLNPKIKFTGGKVGWKGDVPLMQLDNKKIKKLGWKPEKNSTECISYSISQNKV